VSTIVHFVNAGQGNMVLIQTADSKVVVFDCNITDDNQAQVIAYVGKVIGFKTPINRFICSHRDADHMRGIKKLHSVFPILHIEDSDYHGTTTTSSEYLDYMDLRRRIGFTVAAKQTMSSYGRTRIRYFSAQDSRLASNANAQGIVLKVEHRDASDTYAENSTILTADSDAQTWRYAIMQDYLPSDLQTTILMAGHHGSISFFDDPSDPQNYFTNHTRYMNPTMTVVSVGSNGHGHPDTNALSFYQKYSQGSNGHKIWRTDVNRNIKLEFIDGAAWRISQKQ